MVMKASLRRKGGYDLRLANGRRYRQQLLRQPLALEADRLDTGIETAHNIGGQIACEVPASAVAVEEQAAILCR
jgi:hypothetical protein